MKQWRLILSSYVAVLALVCGAGGSTSAQMGSITPLGQQGCAAGTIVGGPTKIINGDFTIDPGPAGSIRAEAAFTSQLSNEGSGIYPDDGFSIQTGNVSYLGGLIVGQPFPGDPQRQVPPSQTYFYSNPGLDSATGKPFPSVLLWEQTVRDLSPDTTYNFFAYFDNLLMPGDTSADPIIELWVNGLPAGPAVTVTKAPDQWVPVQFSFRTGPDTTEVRLQIFDNAAEQIGDDFGMTQINLKQCVTSMGASKYVLEPVNNGDGTFTMEYLIIVRNLGVDPLPLTNIQLIENLAQTFVNVASFAVESISAEGLVLNPDFDGVSDTHLLQGDSQLHAGQAGRVRLKVRLTPGTGANGEGPFDNTIRATAQAGELLVEDSSAPGLNPDTDNDGDPRGPGEDYPTRSYLSSRLLYLPMIQR